MKYQILLLGVLIFALIGCEVKSKKNTNKVKVPQKKNLKKVEPKKAKRTYLDEKNAIPFFYDYAKKKIKKNKVRIITKYGNIDILLYDNTPYHRANFVYLTRRKYFNGTMFHRVVPNFIIQGGNSDSRESMKKDIRLDGIFSPPIQKKETLTTEVSFQCPVVKSTIHTNLHLLMNSLSFNNHPELIIWMVITLLLVRLSGVWKL